MRRSDRGAASILAVTMSGVLLLAGAAAGVVGALVVDHRRAQAAADLAALAGATVRAQQGGEACPAAEEVATANGADLASCVVEGEDVLVEVRVSGPRWLGQDQDLAAQARAGPVR